VSVSVIELPTTLSTEANLIIDASTPSASSGFSMRIQAVFTLLHPELVEGVEGLNAK
jgi:hypothetical protein